MSTITLERQTVERMCDALQSLAEAVRCSQRLYDDRAGYLNNVEEQVAAIRAALVAAKEQER